MAVKVLDCTLRDGGYYNNWDFDSDLVQEYLDVMQITGIDYVELGLRQFKNDSYLGAAAFTSRPYIDRLHLPEGPVYGVMVDAATILSYEGAQEDAIDELFGDKCEEKIGLVRIAAHFNDVSQCLPMLSHLKSKGYLVGLNIMQASLRNSVELTKSAEMVTDFGCVDVLYFADSLGSMLESDVVRVFQAITNGWKGDVGFHAHNNMGQAVSNAAVAMDLGCTWIDGTVTGMGRGAGNAQTEYLLENPKLNKTTNTKSLFNLVVKYFDPMKKIYGWGASMPYFLGAKYGLHPTYVQELCSKSQFDKTYLYDVMADLSVTDNPQAFSRSTMENAISKTTNGGIVTGEKAPPIFKGKEVVLVAQTEISSVYKHAIKDYVNAKGAVLVSINLPSSLMDIDYDFVALSHNQKYREDRESYKDKKYKYIAPKKLFSEAEFLVEHDYGICVNGNFFEIYGNYAYVPNRLTIAYAIAFCLDASAEKISLVGFGGYSLGDPRQKEMEQFLSLLSSKAIEIKSLTPTTYSIPEISIYGI